MQIQLEMVRLRTAGRHAVTERLKAVAKPSALLLASVLLFTGCAHTQSVDNNTSGLSRIAPYSGTTGRIASSAGTSGASRNVSTLPYASSDEKANVVDIARSAIGSRYKYGGTSPETGLDCSGLVCWVYDQVGISVPRRAKEQLLHGQPVGRSGLKPGDIVVFKSPRSRSGWHSGIYSGNGMFVHSPSSGKSVTESSLYEDYYSRGFMGATSLLYENGRLLAASSERASYAASSSQNSSASSVKVASSSRAVAKASASGTHAKAKPASARYVAASKPAATKSSKKDAKAAVVATGSKGARKAPVPASKKTQNVASKTGQKSLVKAKYTVGKSPASKNASGLNANKNRSTVQKTVSENKLGKAYRSATGKGGY